MKQEILFRVKRTIDGGWEEGSFLKYSSSKGTCREGGKEIEGTVFFCEIEPETLCQYMGFTDKHGRKVFEKDIVFIEKEKERFLVAWNAETARFVLEGKGVTADFESYRNYEMEVLGNLFDDPELWKGAEA